MNPDAPLDPFLLNIIVNPANPNQPFTINPFLNTFDWGEIAGAETPLRVFPPGKVGINTDNFVGTHSLYIEGSAIAEEIYVKLMADWGDYVFEPDYVLRSLSEVEAFIKEHKHLPGLQPASEIDANGLFLGEMERIVVEKVEELTLYIITLQKEIDALKADVIRLNGER